MLFSLCRVRSCVRLRRFGTLFCFTNVLTFSPDFSGVTVFSTVTLGGSAWAYMLSPAHLVVQSAVNSGGCLSSITRLHSEEAQARLHPKVSNLAKSHLKCVFTPNRKYYVLSALLPYLLYSLKIRLFPWNFQLRFCLAGNLIEP